MIDRFKSLKETEESNRKSEKKRKEFEKNKEELRL